MQDPHSPRPRIPRTARLRLTVPPKRSSSTRSPSQAGQSPYADKKRGERLQRALADAGVAARRACEELILEGRVKVNGDVVDFLPAWVNTGQDRVRVDGQPVEFAQRLVYVLLNKPTRTLTTAADEPGMDRRTVIDLVDHPSASRLFPVGRLDYDTTGLLIMTNDGWLANRLTHPSYGVSKAYHAVVAGKLTDEDVTKLADGVYLAERRAGRTVGANRTARVQISVHKRDRDRTTLEITLKEGRNRQVRRMLAAVGCPVKKLERVRMGPLQLKGLRRGEWRELDRREVDVLRRAVSARRKGSQADEGPEEPGRFPGTTLSERQVKRAAKRLGAESASERRG